jgi:hypothetical protein
LKKNTQATSCVQEGFELEYPFTENSNFSVTKEKRTFSEDCFDS